MPDPATPPGSQPQQAHCGGATGSIAATGALGGDLRGRLVTPDSPVPAGDAAVQVPPQRVPEAGEGDKATIEFGLTHN